MASSIGGIGGNGSIQGPGDGEKKSEKKGILKTSGGSHEVSSGKGMGKIGDSAQKVAKQVRFAPPTVPPRPSKETLAKFKAGLAGGVEQKPSSPLVKKLGALVKNTKSGISKMKEILKSGLERVKETAEKTGGKIKGAAEKTGGKIKGAAEKTGGKIKGAAGGWETKVNKEKLHKQIDSIKGAMKTVQTKLKRLVGVDGGGDVDYLKEIITQSDGLDEIKEQTEKHADRPNQHTLEEQEQLEVILRMMNQNWETFKNMS